MELKFLVYDSNQVSQKIVRTAISNVAAQIDFYYESFVFSEAAAWKKAELTLLNGLSVALIRIDDLNTAELGLRIYEASPFCRVIYFSEGYKDVCPLLSSRPIAYFDMNEGHLGLEKFLYYQIESLKTDLNFFYHKDRYHAFCIPHSCIYYFTSKNRAVYINTVYGEQGPLRRTLDQIEETLCKDNSFLRCHQSFLVRKTVCLAFNSSDKTILLTDGNRIPVSRAYWQSVAAHFLQKV